MSSKKILISVSLVAVLSATAYLISIFDFGKQAKFLDLDENSNQTEDSGNSSDSNNSNSDDVDTDPADPPSNPQDNGSQNGDSQDSDQQTAERPVCGNFNLSANDNIFEKDLCVVGESSNPEITANYWTWECANDQSSKVCNYYCPNGQIAGNNSCSEITLRIENYYIYPNAVRSDRYCTINWEIYLAEPANLDNTKCVLKTLDDEQITINSFKEGENDINFGISPDNYYSLMCNYQVAETGEYGQIQTDFYECQEL